MILLCFGSSGAGSPSRGTRAFGSLCLHTKFLPAAARIWPRRRRISSVAAWPVARLATDLADFQQPNQLATAKSWSVPNQFSRIYGIYVFIYVWPRMTSSGGPPVSASLRLSLAAHLLSHQIQDAATSWALPQPGRCHIQIQDAATSWALPQPGRCHILALPHPRRCHILDASTSSSSSQPPDSEKGLHTHLTGRRGGCIVVASDARLGVGRGSLHRICSSELAISRHERQKNIVLS